MRKDVTMISEHKITENQGQDPIEGQTNRPTNRDGEPSARSPDVAASSGKLGDGSIADSDSSSPSQPRQTIGRRRLEELSKMLSDRDWKILKSLRKYRFLLTGQIQRLYFFDGTTAPANTRATNRALKKLKGYGLIKPLKRRIGGVRSGSASLVWHLSEAGQRLLALQEPDSGKRIRIGEPSPMFLEHLLSVAECAVQMEVICRESEDLEVVSVDSEPSCWRPFTQDGRIIQLKPDLYAVTTYEEYEDHWFLEMDLSTESKQQVVEKCRVYLNYYKTGIEQVKHDLFPLVVWIVPDKNRKRVLIESIKTGLPSHPKMFLVITPEELEPMLRQYIERDELC